ncbi:MAG: hypothetical protein KGO51_16445 [Alphaproteobacteria bacterium]|nr:hypothetical protein [Alphaproteobacteria bacterium]
MAAVLRRTVGCTQARLLGLTRAERVKCEEQFAGGRNPPPLPIGMDPAKQAAFAARSSRDRGPLLARRPHNGCDPEISEKEFSHGSVGRQDWKMGLGCAVSLDEVGRALHLRH